LGSEQRTVHAIDSSTVVRRRANKERCGRLGKGYCQRAQRAVPANLIAALPTVVLIGGVRVGLVRRTRFGATCQEAVAHVFAALPASPEKRLFSVDAGIATVEQFRAATEREALVGRLRKNVALRRAPHPRRPGQRGRSVLHGPRLHPGAKRPEGRADEDTTCCVEGREVRVRRWRNLHFREAPQTLLDVVRVDDPAYKRPLLSGTTARELTTAEIRSAYAHRWPIGTNFYVARGTCAMERPRAWSETGVERRIRLALLAGSLLKAIAAARTKDTYLAAQYRRLAARRGKKKAVMAVAHSVLVMAYYMLLRHEPYREVGADYFDPCRPEATARRLLKRIQQLGYQVSIAPHPTGAVV
jgi:hypothetical protein